MTVRILVGDVIERLRDLPDRSVQLCCTSPPYFGLRSYLPEGHPDKSKEIGLESTPEEYIARLVAVFREVRRVLRDDGIVYIVIGDSYHSPRWSGGTGGNSTINGKQTQEEFKKASQRRQRGGLTGNKGYDHEASTEPHRGSALAGIKPKDLVGAPWMLAFALRADGWYLRQDVIWAKPDPLPESVEDRCTKAHEYVFMLSKREHYFYDNVAIAEPSLDASVARANRSRSDNHKYADGGPNNQTIHSRPPSPGRSDNKARKPASARGVPVDTGGKPNGAVAGSVPWEGFTRNKRSVWTVTKQPYPDAHFATYPSALVEPMVKAGTSEHGCCCTCGAPWKRESGRACERCDTLVPRQAKACPACRHTRDWKNGRSLSEDMRATDWSTPGRGTPRLPGGFTNGTTSNGWRPTCKCEVLFPLDRCVVLDPFGGAGTTAMVADRLGRDAISIDLNPDYAEMQRRRIKGDGGMFTTVVVEPAAAAAPRAAEATDAA